MVKGKKGIDAGIVENWIIGQKTALFNDFNCGARWVLAQRGPNVVFLFIFMVNFIKYLVREKFLVEYTQCDHLQWL